MRKECTICRDANFKFFASQNYEPERRYVVSHRTRNQENYKRNMIRCLQLFTDDLITNMEKRIL